MIAALLAAILAAPAAATNYPSNTIQPVVIVGTGPAPSGQTYIRNTSIPIQVLGGFVVGITSSCAAGQYLSSGTWQNGVTTGGGCVAAASGGSFNGGTVPNQTTFLSSVTIQDGVSGGLLVAGDSVTASAFFGDGSHLSGISRGFSGGYVPNVTTFGSSVTINGNLPGTDPTPLLLTNQSDGLVGVEMQTNDGNGISWSTYRYGTAGSDRFCIGIIGSNEPFCLNTNGSASFDMGGITTDGSGDMDVGSGTGPSGNLDVLNSLTVGNNGLGGTTSLDNGNIYTDGAGSLNVSGNFIGNINDSGPSFTWNSLGGTPTFLADANTNIVQTLNNTLDDGSGNARVYGYTTPGSNDKINYVLNGDDGSMVRIGKDLAGYISGSTQTTRCLQLTDSDDTLEYFSLDVDASHNPSINTRSASKFSIISAPVGINYPDLTVTYTSKVGIGNVTNPLASLHLPNGTASANTAPLKFSSGTLLTTPERGAVELDASDIYVTRTSTRNKVAFQDFSNSFTASQTFVSSVTISSNSFSVGVSTFSISFGSTTVGGLLHVGRVYPAATTCALATTCTASCPAGTFVDSCGCQDSTLASSGYASSASACTCTATAASGTISVYPICSRIQ